MANETKTTDWFKIAVAMLIQICSIVWFFSTMSADIKINRRDLDDIKVEHLSRSKKIYAIDRIQVDLSRLFEEIKDIKRELRQRP